MYTTSSTHFYYQMPLSELLKFLVKCKRKACFDNFIHKVYPEKTQKPVTSGLGCSNLGLVSAQCVHDLGLLPGTTHQWPLMAFTLVTCYMLLTGLREGKSKRPPAACSPQGARDPRSEYRHKNVRKMRVNFSELTHKRRGKHLRNRDNHSKKQQS